LTVRTDRGCDPMSFDPLTWLRNSAVTPVAVAPSDHDSDLVAWSPLTFIVDSDDVDARRASAMMKHWGVDNVVIPNSQALADALAIRSPDMVMLDVPEDATDALDTILMLGERNFGGTVQLTGEPGAAAIQTIRHLGKRHALQMLPALNKPIQEAALRAVIQAQTQSKPRERMRIDLDEAIRNNWIQFWYQPKIDLLRKCVVGAESFARLFHPQKGLLPPSAFLDGASAQSLLALNELALINALKAGHEFGKLGLNLEIALNVTVNALRSLPVAQIVRTYRPQQHGWPGLIFDVLEEQIVQDLPFVHRISKMLRGSGVKFAIDNFSGSMLSRASLKSIPFAELKIKRNFVARCDISSTESVICQTLIDLAHDLGCHAVAIGVEQKGEARALQNMGCDIAQGYLFSQPLPSDQLVAVLRKRLARKSSAA
jgi:EAL domain-containing protein (putative c-di-GMP-specific phosphodiesterase class I)/AmiR/NasT family two-component response regulator